MNRLQSLGPQLFAFLLTFVLAGLFWFLHHTSMQYIRHMTRRLILINLTFMMFVSLLPFSAALLGRFMHAPIALRISYGHQLALGLLLALQWEDVRRHRLTIETLTKKESVLLPMRLWAIPIACIAALVCAFVRPGWAQSIFVVVIVGGRILGRRKERLLA